MIKPNAKTGMCLKRDTISHRIIFRRLLGIILADKLKTYTDDIYFLSSQSSAFVQGIIITSAHMAKGLEFDEVIIPQATDKNDHSEIDKNMLYVAVTRAMHRLTLTYGGTKSDVIR